MADTNQPAPTSAPDGGTATPPPAPETKPAETKPEATPQTPANPFDSLSEDQKKYLKGQGIESLDAEAIVKVIDHARSSQRTASELKNRVDDITKSLSAPDVPPAQSSQPQADQPAPQTSGDLDPVQAFTLSTSLATSFPELKDDLISGKIYQDMQAVGIPLMRNGAVNLNGITNFAKLAQERAQLNAKLEELSKPGENAIPDANPTLPQQPAADAPMTLELARAILAADRNHPRAEEAAAAIREARLGKR